MENKIITTLLEDVTPLKPIINMDGVYTCVKDVNSKFVFCNENFATLVGSTVKKIVGTVDERAEHVKDDAAVRKSGVPLLNHREVIKLPDGKQQPILTQKGLWRCENDPTKILGTTVNFSLQKSKEDWIHDLGLKRVDRVGYFGIDTAHDENKDSNYSLNYILIDNKPNLKLHKLAIDEQWYYHEGSALKIYIFDLERTCVTVKLLGRNVTKGEKLQAVVPKNTWFGAKVVNDDFNLSSCSLAPAFYNRCSMPILVGGTLINQLKATFPDYATVIDELS